MYTGPEYGVIIPRRDYRVTWLNGYRWTTRLTPDRPGYARNHRTGYVRLPDGVTLPAAYIPATAGLDSSHGPRRQAVATAIAGKIVMGDEYLCNGWCCVDCLMMLANGEGNPEWTEKETAEYDRNVAHYTAGCNVTLGLMREDHGCASTWTITDQAGETYEYRAKDVRDALDKHEWHHDLADVATVAAHDLETESDRGGECECEQDSFSWSQCDVCGSNLGGSRDAVVFFKIIYR